jgi:putative Holliday junction resolvase
VPAIRAIVKREEVGGIVIGLPLLPSGDEGDSAVMARRMGARLDRILEVEVVYEDERLTTVAADARAREAGGRRRPTDDLAATVLLEQFLEQRRTTASCAARTSVGDETA